MGLGLSDQRDALGSANAWAWRHALGEELPTEIIVLPDEEKRLTTSGPKPSHQATPTPLLLEAYPNPTDGPQWLVYRLPEGVENASLRIIDALGRERKTVRLNSQMGLLELPTAEYASGLYFATLSMDGIAVQTAKLLVQR